MIIRNIALAVSCTALLTSAVSADELFLSEVTPQTLLQQSSTIEQIGSLSRAVVDQTRGDEGISGIRQLGESHTARVTQSNNKGNIAGFNTPANVSVIEQRGIGAIATVTQAGRQNAGTENTSTIDQRSRGTGPGNQIARVDQSGVAQFSDIVQRGNDTTARVTQGGEGHMSTVFQQSNQSTAVVDQGGSAHFSDIQQLNGTRNSLARVTQNGDNNTSTILQTSLMPGTGSHNQIAIVEQSRNDNFSEIFQDGGSVILTVAPGNTANVMQTANDLVNSTINQSGAGLTAIVRQ